MATTYFTPGVYVEEVPSAIVPITGVSTSTAGFIGVVSRDVTMPLMPPDEDGSVRRYPVAEPNKPVLIDSWTRFTTSFGDVQAGNRVLAVAVSGFFDNGGGRCWVTAVASRVRGSTLDATALKNEKARLATEKRRLEREKKALATRAEAGPTGDEKDKLQADQARHDADWERWESDQRAFDEHVQAADELRRERGRVAAEEEALADLAKRTDLSADERADLARRRTKLAEDQEALATEPIDRLGPDVKAALEGFEAIDDISLVVVPGATSGAVRAEIIKHCENRADRFAILDGNDVTELTKDAVVQRGTADSDYAAIYFPWIEASWAESRWTGRADDPPTLTARRGFVPPSGHVAGVYARVDESRGVHKAPANEQIRGALDVRTLVSKRGQSELNRLGVNVIRKFGNNVTIWGARTTAAAGKPEWTYVTARRLFIYLRESIEAGAQWVVFEPNSPELWSKIRMNVSAFLNTVWASGALMGATPEQAYFVRCDETTNLPEVRDAGRVVTVVGVALVKPAEFVVFRLSQWAGPGQ